ncbi:MAG TPA: hypothetical protein DIT97_13160, partial [Gimesia maris]|nr:hypothetical protein [Gimesia maris]
MRRTLFASPLILLVLILFASRTGAQTTLIPFGKHSTWRYQDDGQPLAPDWIEPKFDDSNWKSGTAPLGYGEADISTTLSFGSAPQQKTITA